MGLFEDLIGMGKGFMEGQQQRKAQDWQAQQQQMTREQWQQQQAKDAFDMAQAQTESDWLAQSRPLDYASKKAGLAHTLAMYPIDEAAAQQNLATGDIQNQGAALGLKTQQYGFDKQVAAETAPTEEQIARWRTGDVRSGELQQFAYNRPMLAMMGNRANTLFPGMGTPPVPMGNVAQPAPMPSIAPPLGMSVPFQALGMNKSGLGSASMPPLISSPVPDIPVAPPSSNPVPMPAPAAPMPSGGGQQVGNNLTLIPGETPEEYSNAITNIAYQIMDGGQGSFQTITLADALKSAAFQHPETRMQPMVQLPTGEVMPLKDITKDIYDKERAFNIPGVPGLHTMAEVKAVTENNNATPVAIYNGAGKKIGMAPYSQTAELAIRIQQYETENHRNATNDTFNQLMAKQNFGLAQGRFGIEQGNYNMNRAMFPVDYAGKVAANEHTKAVTAKLKGENVTNALVDPQVSKMLKAERFIKTAGAKDPPLMFKGKPVWDENGNLLTRQGNAPKGSEVNWIAPMNVRAIRSTPKDPPGTGQAWPTLGGIDIQTYFNYLQTQKGQAGKDVITVAGKAYNMGYGKGLRGRDLYSAVWDGLANIFGDMPMDTIPEDRYANFKG